MQDRLQAPLQRVETIVWGPMTIYDGFCFWGFMVFLCVQTHVSASICAFHAFSLAIFFFCLFVLFPAFFCLILLYYYYLEVSLFSKGRQK